MFISLTAAHSSHLVLKNDDEGPKGDDNGISGGDVYDEPPEDDRNSNSMARDDSNNDIPEEDIDDDGMSSDGHDKLLENVIDTQDEALASNFGMEILASDQNTGERLMEDELISQI